VRGTRGDFKARVRSARLWAAVLVAAASVALTATPAFGAAPTPGWEVESLPTPTNFIPGDTAHDYSYDVRIVNAGAAVTDGSPITITDVLPEGLTVESVELPLRFSLSPTGSFDFGPYLCNIDAGPPPTVECTLPEKYPEDIFGPTSDEPSRVFPSEEIRMVINVAVPTGTPAMPLENHATVEGGGAEAAATVSHNATTDEVNPQPASGGFTYADAELTGPDGKPVLQAASHPYQYTTSFAVNTKLSPPGNLAPFVPAGGDVKDLPVRLPPGLVGNPTATEKCSAKDFNEFHTVFLDNGGLFSANECPDSSAVGLVRLQQVDGTAGLIPVPLYNLVPPEGMPAQFGFQINGLPFFIDIEVRPEDNYQITAALRNTSQAKRVTAASVTVWGEPAASIHDTLRGSCLNALPEKAPLSLGSCPAGIENRPFLRLPTSCSTPMDFLMSFDTWSTPGVFSTQNLSLPHAVGCDQVPFEPALTARPTNQTADAPTGLQVDLHLPQNEAPEELGTADLRHAVVTLPEGLVLNPSGANGLEACSPAQIGLLGATPLRFNGAAPACPDASRIGQVEVVTPLVDHPLEGSIYVAQPHENPFGSLLAIYLAVDDPISGVVVKLAGRVEADSKTGQLRTVFADTPQVPFEDFKLEFDSGPLAPLRTPAVCGEYRTTSSLIPWSAPESGSPAAPSDLFGINSSPTGGPCPRTASEEPNTPSFEAGTASAKAKAYTSLVVDLQRDDGSQEVSGLQVTLPPGLIAKLARVPYCPDSALVEAAARSGASEANSPSCPSGSQLGAVTIGAGAGSRPYFTQGKIYLAGPYQGAPVSLAIVTPAVAGPYDLGTVVVRAAVRINPLTTEVTAVSDPIPHILQGIPLDIRSITVHVDRSRFILNPTSCDAMSMRGNVTSVLEQTAAVSNPFQVHACSRLGFKPRLGLRLLGGTRRNAHPRLRATLRLPSRGANIAGTSVALPHSEFLEQAHIRTICTRVQFASDDCPRGSVYGHVRVNSPLVDYPLAGPVYLRSSSHQLPDLVLALRGPRAQPIRIEAVGRIDSVRGGLRVTFEQVPDVPFSKLVLNMRGGKRGLLVNSRNICGQQNRAVAQFDGQNGKVYNVRPVLRARCGKG
jgi:hypothetical protein